ncbi:MAG: LrgB family protein [Gammaproteobacteria bacterium]|nr:LrgB family protein [Gammaproteobacteria bacterium]
MEQIWVYLAASPLFGLTATLVAYSLGHWLYVRCGSTPLLHPVLTAVSVLILLLWLGDISYASYFDGAQFVHFLLGPATVALAVPLYLQLERLRKLWLPILISLIFGVLLGALSALGIARWLGAGLETQLSLAPKSVTTPVAMGIAETIGGLPSLTAVLVVTTGIIGAVLGNGLFRLLRIKDDSVKGIAMGVAAHGIGTARAFQLSQQMGAFSGLAMALSALASALILPSLIGWLF